MQQSATIAIQEIDVDSLPSPLVQRRRLRAELKRARLEAGLTQESVAEAMDWSPSKIIRIEAGSVGISTNDLTALLRLYGVNDPQQVADLVALGRVARQQAWYSKYRSMVGSVYFQFIEYEASASVIRSYETMVVPGLLQTREYATKITRNYRLHPDPETVEDLVDIRMERQRLLFEREDAPSLLFVLDEAVIHRLLGDEETGYDQLIKLISAADKPKVTIEVIPFSVGLHSGIGENFIILEFNDPSDDDVLYFESAREFIFTQDDAEETSIYRELFGDLRSISLGPKMTLDYLRDSAQAMT